MKITSNSEIVEKLKISYDGLETIQQDMFLDIACFFRGHEKDDIMPILESCYSGATNIGLNVLIDKSVVFISKSECGEYDTIQMHDLIEDMGKYIVKLRKSPGERSRLWDVEDIEEVMVHNTGTMAVEVIWSFYSRKLWFSKDAMKNMQRLRILSIRSYYLSYYAEGIDDSEESDGSIDYLPNGPIDYLPNNLCWFAWHGYPWKLLPQNFNPTRLVHIDLRRSSLHHLWNQTKQLPSLRRLYLSSSKSLKSTPDFTGMPNLEYLDLSDCTSLEELHDSLRCSRKLIDLNLYKCESLERFPYVNVESLEYLNLRYCSSLKKFPEFFGIMKPELVIKMRYSGIRELPSSIILPQWAHRTKLDLRDMNNLVSLPSSICELKDLVELNVSRCSKLETLPEGIGDLERLEWLDASYTLISRPPSSIIRLNKLKALTFAKKESEDRAYFVFPEVNEGLVSLEELDLSFCNLIDGGLPEDIGSLSSLKKLNLRGNNFEHLPRSIAQLGALQSLDLTFCDKLKELPGFTGMTTLHTLDLSFCNLIDGGLPEDIGSLFSLKELDLSGNNFEHLPRSIAQLGALQSLDLSDCKRLAQLPEFPQQLGIIDADWSSDSICNSLFQNMSSLQHDISASDSLSLRVFHSCEWDMNIPRWFHHQVTGRSVSVNLRENWYVSDNFLGFAVCYTGELHNNITAHLIPLCDDGASSMTKKFALSKPPFDDLDTIHFFLIPLAVLWDASKANGKMPNDYGRFQLYFPRYVKRNFGVRLLYKDELQIGMRRSRDEEATVAALSHCCNFL